VRFRLHPLFLLLFIVAICAAVIVVVSWLRSRSASKVEHLMAFLPQGDPVVLEIDVSALRRSGVLDLLAGAKVAEEPEYKAFVAGTGFDYRSDLDLILAAFQKESSYYLLRGRFDWKRITAYAAGQGGLCRNSFCRVVGSTPKRNISFFPLRPGVMALAVSTDAWAASDLMARKERKFAFQPPGDPVWLHLPASRLKDTENLPAGTRLFAKAMESADRVTLSLAAQEGRFEARLDVACRTAQDASVLSFQLEGVTRLLRSLINREKQTPNPGDLSGLLAKGSFHHQDRRVLGRWPVQREFLERLTGGSL
jgi:hypothetical protein